MAIEALETFRQTMTGASAPREGEKAVELLAAAARRACADLGLHEAEIYAGGPIVTMLLTPRHAWEAVVVGPNAYQLYPGFVSEDGGSITWANVWVADNYDLAKFVRVLDEEFASACGAERGA